MSALRTALLAVGLALAGLIGLVAVFDGADTYRDIARASGVAQVAFHAPAGAVWYVDLNTLVTVHERTLAYVLGDAPELPTFATTAGPLFDDSERSHMADVRGVFGGAKLAFVFGVVLVIGVLRWTDRTLRPRTVRDGAIAAGVGVTALAIGAVVAFDPLFLLFHEIFFPQGNFLFAPDSNLLVLYPEGYWYGVTLRIGITFVALMVVVALAAAATLRWARR